MHSLAPRPGVALVLLVAAALPSGPVAASETRTSDAALQQRIELLERGTAALKGRLAALAAAQQRLDARPTIESCAAFGALAKAVGAEVDALAMQYADLSGLAERYPDRQETARQGAAALVRVRDELLGHALTVTGQCRAMGVEPEPPTGADPEALPVSEGVALLAGDGSVLFLSALETESLREPAGGLRLGRLVAGAAEELPDVLWVRLEGVASDRAGLAASFFPEGRTAGARATAQYIASPGALRGVVVLPAEGPLAETWALAGLARAFQVTGSAPPEAGCTSAPSSDFIASSPTAEAHRSEVAPIRFSALERVHLGLGESGTASTRAWSPAADATGGKGATCLDPAARGRQERAPSVALVVVTREPMPAERRADVLADWRRFVAPGPDRDPTTSNFFEAAEGTPCRLARLRARPGGCTSGAPDLP